jgi:hypothetical protein
MAEEVLVVFTAKSVETCLEVGGTQSWVLTPARARRCRYAVLCRNTNKDWCEGEEPHGTAFMIGRISGVVPSTETPGRWLVTFNEYARIDIPNVWQGWRNPVRYATLDELSLGLDGVRFEPMPQASKEAEKAKPVAARAPVKLTITEAKEGLALAFGVKPDAIEIIIHG